MATKERPPWRKSSINRSTTSPTTFKEALRASERNLLLIVETISSYGWCGTPSGEIKFVNKGILDYTGKTLEELKKSDVIGGRSTES
jgi:PAS domain-containing protein